MRASRFPKQQFSRLVRHLDLPRRIDDTEAIPQRVQHGLQFVAFLRQLCVAALFELSVEILHLLRGESQRPFQECMALVSLHIASVDPLEQLAP